MLGDTDGVICATSIYYLDRIFSFSCFKSILLGQTDFPEYTDSMVEYGERKVADTALFFCSETGLIIDVTSVRV